MTAAAFDGPVCIVVNGGSAEGDARREALTAALTQQGLAHELFRASPAQSIAACAERAVQLARSTQGMVAAVGGDGTVNTVAHALGGRRVPLGVLPSGTFNYFARAHALPEDPHEAVSLWATTSAQPVQVGQVNEQRFVVNASLGLYPKLLRAREEDNARLGRWRIVAAWSALRTVLRDNRSMTLLLDDGAGPRRVRTPTLFIGNNPLQLDLFGLPQAEATGSGVLAAVSVKPVSSARLVTLALRGLIGALGPEPEVDAAPIRELRVQPLGRRAGRPIAVAFDGELQTMQPPLSFRVAAEPLWLIKPAPATPT